MTTAPIDIRMDVAFLRNLKTRKLIDALGAEGIVALLGMWCYTRERHPLGVLDKVGIEDLERLSGWTGMRGAFASYATSMGWVDVSPEGVLSVHDWEDHQPWAFGAEKRSQAAKKASSARWETQEKRKVNPRRIRPASGPYAEGNAPSPSPSPSPSPNKDLTAGATAGGFEAPAEAPKATRAKDACAFIGGCEKTGTIKHGDGRWYCRRHDPDAPPPTPGNGAGDGKNRTAIPPIIRALNLTPEKSEAVTPIFLLHISRPIPNEDLATQLLGAGLTANEVFRTAQAFFGTPGKH